MAATGIAKNGLHFERPNQLVAPTIKYIKPLRRIENKNATTVARILSESNIRITAEGQKRNAILSSLMLAGSQ
jgi:hypothetical protein